MTGLLGETSLCEGVGPMVGLLVGALVGRRVCLFSFNNGISKTSLTMRLKFAFRSSLSLTSRDEHPTA